MHRNAIRPATFAITFLLSLLTIAPQSTSAQESVIYSSNSDTHNGDGLNPLGSRSDAKENLSGRARPAITKVSTNAPVTTYAGNGFEGSTGDGGPAIQAELELGDYVSGPYGDMAFDSAGNLYFADGDRIRKVAASTGIITTVAGGGTACTGFCGDGGPATEANLGYLASVTTDPSGNLYIAASSMILRVDASSGILTVVAGTYTCGSGILGPSCSGSTGYSGDNGPATSAQLHNLTGTVTIDSAGNLYIVDQTNTTSNVVRKVTASTGIITTIAGRGPGCAGQTDSYGDGCPATDSTLLDAGSIALDASENLYISAYGQSAIRRIDASTGIISTVFAGGNGICSAATDNLGDGCPTTEAHLSPAGIALDSSGDIFIGEPGQCRVREVDTSGIIHLVAGVNGGSTGSCGYSGLTASTAKFARAGSLTFDANGNLYVADDENYVVRKIGFGSTPAQVGTTTTLTSNGNPQGKGANVIFTADVEPSSGTETPTGTVTFTIDGAVVGAATLDSSGHASYATSTLIPNIHTIQVGYAGDANHAASISDVLSETITVEAATATPVFSPPAGPYLTAQTVTITDATSGATIYYTTDGSTPTTASAKYTQPINVTQTETITAIAVATGLAQNQASASYIINGTVATPEFSQSTGSYGGTQTITIADTTPGAVIYYTTDGTTPTTTSTQYSGAITVSSTETIKAIAAATNYNNSAVASATYTILPLTPTPTISPLPGNFYYAQTVTIADSNSKAVIHYTTNGTTPTTSSPVYTASFVVPVGTTETIEAIAVAPGDAPSAVVSETLVIPPAVPNPTISPAPGTYTAPVTVTLSDSLAGTSLYYYINSGSVISYTGPFTISQTSTVNYLGGKSGYSDSPWIPATYTITPPAATPTFSPAPGTYATPQSVTIADTTPGAEIYYTLNGTKPSTASTKYTGAITVSSTETIEAIAVATGYSTSAVASATYTITPATISLAPAALTFPTTITGATSLAQTVTITNTGTSTVTFRSYAFTGTDASAFSLGPKTCGTSLAVGASCTLSVSFKPAAAGTLTANLVATDSAAGSPQSVVLTGTGQLPPTVTLTPNEFAFPDTTVGATSAPQVVTVKNIGTATVTVRSYTFTGAGAASYLIVSKTCGTSLASGASCTITLAFKPTEVGSLPASFNATDSSPGSPQTAALIGTGGAQPTISLSSTSLNFPPTKVGAISAAQTITLTNTGSTTYVAHSYAFTGANATSFSISSKTCGTLLASGASCTISIAFKPTATGTLTGNLAATDNAVGSPQTVTLTGTAP